MKPTSTVSTVFGLALLAAVAYGLFLAATAGVALFVGLDATVQLFAAGAATLLVCAAMIANGLHAGARGEDLRQRRALRGTIYDQALQVRAAAPGTFRPEDEDRVERGILLHASPAVVSAYLRVRRADDGGSPDDLAQLARTMRRDLGRRGSDVSVDDLAELLRPAQASAVSVAPPPASAAPAPVVAPERPRANGRLGEITLSRITMPERGERRDDAASAE